MKKIMIAAAIALCSSPLTFAGGKGGTELGLASYSGVGIIASKGIPLDVEFLSSKGLYSFGELEFGVGFGDDFAAGVELSAGLLFPIDNGISIYGSLGPALGFGDDTEFGLGAEIGLNIDVNESLVFIEAGTHPASNYFAVGMRF
ncbi:hypothetical protein [Reinekea marinisedimentorum]|uniref:Outer membrane protein with beta-barrel domain n=1 Tax=Reinekea marinisedimentorum TaxID=230495 RepID=A0A4R3I7S7_9GAMM|nr:hypothetical protein [Reinekea marinisedimentorum]TCS42097.1 hypothetical protein BCF53_104202 [Reinekea marinisedimentorum]